MFRSLFNFAFLRDNRRRKTGSGRRPRKALSHRPALLALEGRTLPSTIAWLRPVSGDWDTPANWAGGLAAVLASGLLDDPLHAGATESLVRGEGLIVREVAQATGEVDGALDGERGALPGA